MNLFIFHIHSITPRQSIPYPDIMTKDRHYQLGITVMTLISHNTYPSDNGLTSKKFFFFKKDAEVQTKKTQKCWVILYQHLCVFQDMSDPLWGFLIQYPHIFLYTNIQSPSPYAMLSYTQMSHVTPCFIILRSTARHPIKSDVYT